MGETEDERTLYCGNLHDNVTEELLYELFLQAGPLERVHIPQKDGKKRNFGFITFKHSVSVPYSVELLNGIQLFHRSLRLQSRASGGNQNRQQNSGGSRMAEMNMMNGPQGMVGMGGQFQRSISAPDMATVRHHSQSPNYVPDRSQDFVRDRSRDRDRSFDRQGDRDRGHHRNQSRDRDGRDYSRERGRERDRFREASSSGASSGNSTPEHPHGRDRDWDGGRMNRSETFPGQYGHNQGSGGSFRGTGIHQHGGTINTDSDQFPQEMQTQRLMGNQQFQMMPMRGMAPTSGGSWRARPFRY